MRISSSITLLVMAISCILLAAPAQGLYEENEYLDDIVCVADNNEAHVKATQLEIQSVRLDAVGTADQFDWYKFNAYGDLDWNVMMSVETTKAGLAVRLYYDSGTGLTQVHEESPKYDATSKLYQAQIPAKLSIQNKGFTGKLNGVYYIRITYYSAYPGDHPYKLLFMAQPVLSGTGSQNAKASAKQVVPNGAFYGLFNNSDMVDWYYWDDPSGEPVDGFIELMDLSSGSASSTPPLKFELYKGDGPVLAQRALKPGERSALADLDGQGLTSGKYYIKVFLDSAYTELVPYLIRNFSTRGKSDGYAPDTNSDTSSAAAVAFNGQANSTICWPRDKEDYFKVNGDRYFIGDIKVMHNADLYGIVPGVEITGEVHKSSSGFFMLSFNDNPIPTGEFYIKIMDMSYSRDIKPYKIELVPDGAGPYHTPGHSTWDTAETMTSKGKIWFELEQGKQTQMLYKAETTPQNYFAGPVEIIGSQADYEVLAGKLLATGPAWGPVQNPSANGRVFIDLGFDVLAEQGNLALRIKMNNGTTGRRRFYITEDLLAYTPMPPGIPNTFAQPGGSANYDYNDEKWKAFGSFYPPQLTKNYCLLKVASDKKQGILPSDWMFVRAGYPNMKFKLYDKTQKLLWETTVATQGGFDSVHLASYTQAGNDYILEVSTDATQTRMLFWKADFPVVPPMLMMKIKPETVIDLNRSIIDIDPSRIKKKN